MQHPSPEQIAYMQAHAHESRQSWLIGTNIAFLVLTVISVALRFTARIKIGTHIGLDDWFIFGAAACVLGHVSCLLVAATRNGMGRHVVLIQDPPAFIKVTITAQTFYNLSIPLAKLSILCLYNRIFRRTGGWFMPTLWGTGIFVSLSAIPPVFVYIFQCVPIRSLWGELRPGETSFCLNFKAAIITFGVINIITDIYILALPIPVVLGLHLDKRTKVSVCSLFSVGAVVCIISLIRLLYAKNVETVDPTWDLVPIAVLSTLEASAAVLVACMPTWRPLFRFLGRGITSYFAGSSKSGRSSDAENLKYGSNKAIGRGRWLDPAHISTTTDTELTITGAKGSRVSFIMGQKRSETSMSGDSIEKMLPGQELEMEPTSSIATDHFATTTTTAAAAPSTFRTQTPSPSPMPIRAPTPVVGPSQPTPSAGPASRSPPRSVPDITFSSASSDYAYKASAGADRWESLMKQQQIKNKAKEKEKEKTRRHSGEKAKDRKKPRYGEVAYGGGASSVRPEGRGETEGRSSRGLGLGGITVTRTVVSVSDEGR